MLRAFHQLAKSLTTQLPRYEFGRLQEHSKLVQFDKWKVVKGDKVTLIAGKDKGKIGTVMRVYRKQNKVLVQGINLKLKRIKSMDEGEQGGIKQVCRPIDISNVSLIDPEKGTQTRVTLGYTEDGKKVRLSKLSGSLIMKPFNPAFQVQHRNKNKVDGILDTKAPDVLEVTYKGEDFASLKAKFDQMIKEKEEREKMLVF